MICSLVCGAPGWRRGSSGRATGDPRNCFWPACSARSRTYCSPPAGWGAVQLHFARYLRDVLVPLIACRWRWRPPWPSRSTGPCPTLRLPGPSAADRRVCGVLPVGAGRVVPGLSKDERGHFQRVGVGIASRLPGPVKGVGSAHRRAGSPPPGVARNPRRRSRRPAFRSLNPCCRDGVLARLTRTRLVERLIKSASYQAAPAAFGPVRTAHPRPGFSAGLHPSPHDDPDRTRPPHRDPPRNSPRTPTVPHRARPAERRRRPATSWSGPVDA